MLQPVYFNFSHPMQIIKAKKGYKETTDKFPKQVPITDVPVNLVSKYHLLLFIQT